MQMRTDPHVSAVKSSNAFVKAVTTELMRLSEVQAAVEEQRAVLGYWHSGTSKYWQIIKSNLVVTDSCETIDSTSKARVELSVSI